MDNKNMESFIKTSSKLEIYRKIAEAEAEMESGEVLFDGNIVFDELRAKFGIK